MRLSATVERHPGVNPGAEPSRVGADDAAGFCSTFLRGIKLGRGKRGWRQSEPLRDPYRTGSSRARSAAAGSYANPTPGG